MTDESLSKGRAPKWRRRREARPEEIVDAALACFAERGFAATRLEEIALRAGIAKPTLYLYFDTKESLFIEVVRSRLASVIAELGQLQEKAPSASEALRMLVNRMAATLRSPAGALPKLIVSEAQAFPELARLYVDTVIEPGIAAVEAIIRSGIKSGEFRKVDARAIAFSLCASVVLESMFRHGLQPATGRTLRLPDASAVVDALLAECRK
jgi:AcrR family transcriptional regulator